MLRSSIEESYNVKFSSEDSGFEETSKLDSKLEPYENPLEPSRPQTPRFDLRASYETLPLAT